MGLLPEDKSTGPGYWIFKWPFRISQCLMDAVDFHDAATSDGSSQEKAEIPGSMVDDAFIKQIEGCAKETGEWWTVRVWRAVITVFGRWFSEGKYFKKD